MENVVLSIVVPVYNVEKYVEKCLTSLLEQSFKDFEVIIVNDGSTDLSRQICENFINAHNLANRFFILDKSNGGLSDARNYGMKFARGQYISFLDSDDYVDSDTYELLIGKMRPGIKMVQCSYYLTYSNKEKIVTANEYRTIGEMAAKGLVVAWNKLFLRSFLLEKSIEFPVGLYYEDIYFYYKILEHLSDVRTEVSTVNKPLIHYVQRNNSIMLVNTRRVLDILKIYQLLETCLLKDEVEYRCSKNFNGSFLKKALAIQDKRDRHFVIDSFKQYLKNVYPKWKKNRYYSFFSFKDFVIRFISPLLRG